MRRVVTLINYGTEINLMSMDFYRKGKWSINTKDEWKIRTTTRAIDELHGALPEHTSEGGHLYTFDDYLDGRILLI